MSTAMNCTVNIYKGVPLIKGGTEVLYESQGSAIGVLGSFLYKSYNLYYYSRENRGAIQVEDVIQNVEGINYIAFQNISHGGKWFFGFVDQIVYINDNNTEIQFTIDPFPTYKGDAKELTEVFIVRNSPKTDSPFLIAPDFENCGRAYTYVEADKVEYELTKIICVFSPGRLQSWDDQGTVIADIDSSLLGTPLSQYGQSTGLKYAVNPSDQLIKVINQSGGTIIGIYAVDSGFDPATLSTDSLSLTIAPASGLHHLKLSWSDQYNKIFISGAGQGKEYYISKFLSPQSTIVFRIKKYMNPVPTLCIYPEDYEGAGFATNEAIVIQYPTLAYAVSNGDVGSALAGVGNTIYNKLGSAYYDDSKGWRYGDSIIETGQNQMDSEGDPRFENLRIIGGALTKAIGGAVNFATALGKGSKAVFNSLAGLGTAMKGMKASEITTTAGGLVLTSNNKMIFRLIHCRPNIADLQAMDKYMDYYGYNYSEVRTPNTDDKAYLQTGQPFVYGSEADDVLNTYFMRGIKIRRNLTNPPVAY